MECILIWQNFPFHSFQLISCKFLKLIYEYSICADGTDLLGKITMIKQNEKGSNKMFHAILQLEMSLENNSIKL